MKNVALPKWATILSSLSAAAGYVLTNRDLISAIPGNTSKSVVATAGTVLFVVGLIGAAMGVPVQTPKAEPKADTNADK